MIDNERINRLFLVVIVVAAEAFVCSTDFQPTISGNDYVLRSCMSSVELNRRNVHSTKSKSYSSPDSLPKQIDILPVVRYPMSRYRVKSVETRVRGKSQPTLGKSMLPMGRYKNDMITDTPVKTLKIERRGRQKVPQLYVKNNLLLVSPEKNLKNTLLFRRTNLTPP